MWLFTTLGFFSCTRSKEDFTKMQIRARTKGDIERLKLELGIEAPIIETRTADYRWRLVLTPRVFSSVVNELVQRIDYCNFKQAVHEAPGQEDKAGPYLKVWHTMAGLQAAAHRPAAPEPYEPEELFRPDYFMENERLTDERNRDLDAELEAREALENPRAVDPPPAGRQKLIHKAHPVRRTQAEKREAERSKPPKGYRITLTPGGGGYNFLTVKKNGVAQPVPTQLFGSHAECRVKAVALCHKLEEAAQ